MKYDGRRIGKSRSVNAMAIMRMLERLRIARHDENTLAGNRCERKQNERITRSQNRSQAAILRADAVSEKHHTKSGRAIQLAA